jgi:hypothetical protein
MNCLLSWLQPKTHTHKIVVTYLTGSTRKKYEGTDKHVAEEAYEKARSKWLEPFGNILSVEWYRDDKVYKHV